MTQLLDNQADGAQTFDCAARKRKNRSMMAKFIHAWEQAFAPDRFELVSELPLQECRALLLDNIEPSLSLRRKKPLFGHVSGNRFEVYGSARRSRTVLRGELSQATDKTYIRGRFSTGLVHAAGFAVVAALGGIGGLAVAGTYVLAIFAALLAICHAFWLPFATSHQRRYITRTLEILYSDNAGGSAGGVGKPSLHCA